jgi:hypothetical protein
MREFVGVKHPFQLLGYPSIKREALIFSKIALPHYNSDRYEYYDGDRYESLAYLIKSKLSDNLLNELDWLIENGVIITPESIQIESSLFENKEYGDSIIAEANKYLNAGLHIGMRKGKGIPDDLDDESLIKAGLDDESCSIFFESAFQETIRRTCIELRLSSGLEAHPIFFDNLQPLENVTSNKSSIVKIILKALPTPDESTSWEQILEYRSDPDSRNKFLDLRNWMSDIARGELTPVEMEEKLEYLLSQYQRHMEVHKMKINVGTLETVVVSGAEILEDLIHLRFSKAAKALFSVKHRRIALMEGELSSPGSEIAYIVKTKEAFYNPAPSNNSFNRSGIISDVIRKT